MIVSNTEISMYNTCERSHFYRFVMNIEPQPKNLSIPLKRGILGHAALDRYYSAIKDGTTAEEAAEYAKKVVLDGMSKALVEEGTDLDVIIYKQLIKLFEGYHKVYKHEPFEVIELETVHTVPIAPGIEYGLRLDMLVRMVEGALAGQLVLIDNKFVYNFKTKAELDMDCQLPKYARTLRENGLPAYKKMFNELRHRQLKEPAPTDVYRRMYTETTDVESDRIWREQRATAIQIVKKREDPEKYRAEAVRNLSPYICRGCPFQRICKLELQGKSLKNEIIMNFQPNTYGYNNLMTEDN